MKKTSILTIALVLSFAATAAADEPRFDSARTAGILSVLRTPQLAASYELPPTAARAFAAEDGPSVARPGLCRAGEACEARGTVRFARPLFRSVGWCDADALAELASEIGRLGAIEQCTGHGTSDVTTRPLRRALPASAFAARQDPDSDPLAGLDL